MTLVASVGCGVESVGRMQQQWNEREALLASDFCHVPRCDVVPATCSDGEMVDAGEMVKHVIDLEHFCHRADLVLSHCADRNGGRGGRETPVADHGCGSAGLPSKTAEAERASVDALVVGGGLQVRGTAAWQPSRRPL